MIMKRPCDISAKTRHDASRQVILPTKRVIMTGNCDTARLFRRLAQEHITEVALKQRISPYQIHIHEADCWHHL